MPIIDGSSTKIAVSDIQLGAVEVKDSDTDVRANVKAANTARTTATIVVATQEVGADGTVPPTGSAKTNAPFSKITDGTNDQPTMDAVARAGFQKITDGTSTAAVLARTTGQESPAITDDPVVVYNVGAAVLIPPTHISPVDFAATYTSSTTITCSGAPFTIADANCYVTHIDYFPSGSTFSKRLINGVNGVSIKAAANVITVAGAGTPFAASDTYYIGVRAQNKGYHAANTAFRGEIINRKGDSVPDDDLVDTTNVTAASHYYPSSSGLLMEGYRDYSVSGKLIDADGTLTLTIEGMNDEDTTSGDWIQLYAYDDKNNVTTNSWSVTNGTLTYAISLNNCNYKYLRVVVVANGATNTVIVKGRRKEI